MAAQTTGRQVAHHPARSMVMLATGCLRLPLQYGHGDRAVSAMTTLVQGLPTVARKGRARPTDDARLSGLHRMALSLRPNVGPIVALAAGLGFVDPLLSARPGDQPARIALDCRATKSSLIGSLAAIAAVAMLRSHRRTGSLAVATVMWQLAIALGLGVPGAPLAGRARPDRESSKE